MSAEDLAQLLSQQEWNTSNATPNYACRISLHWIPKESKSLPSCSESKPMYGAFVGHFESPTYVRALEFGSTPKFDVKSLKFEVVTLSHETAY